VIPQTKLREIINWLENGVNFNKYIKPFICTFRGVQYDTKFSPARVLKNASNCKRFVNFINNTIIERLADLGRVGSVEPPHIVSPLTIEPTKPRMCINLMYLNNWIQDIPFSLDTLMWLLEILCLPPLWWGDILCLSCPSLRHTVCQRIPSETTEQNFMKLGR
jgi:hypothetical protein